MYYVCIVLCIMYKDNIVWIVSCFMCELYCVFCITTTLCELCMYYAVCELYCVLCVNCIMYYVCIVLCIMYKDNIVWIGFKTGTGWRRLIGSPKLQIIFHKRATKYRALLRKMTYKDKGSYESSPPCTTANLSFSQSPVHENGDRHTEVESEKSTCVYRSRAQTYRGGGARDSRLLPWKPVKKIADSRFQVFTGVPVPYKCSSFHLSAHNWQVFTGVLKFSDRFLRK